MKKICVITTTRAEYGLLKNIIREIDNDNELELCLIVSGTHLKSDYGMTVNEIIEDGYRIDERVEVVDTQDSPKGISILMADYQLKFADVFEKHRPDMVVLLGDRFELMPIACNAVNFNIPIAHISGGETTEGAVDEVFRHGVTKMSQLHFPACELYRKRIIQMGEDPARVFNVGDVGVENIKNLVYYSKTELEKELGIEFIKPVYSVTFHPVTQELSNVKIQIRELLDAIEFFAEDYIFVFSKANSDAGGQLVNHMIEEFVGIHNNCYLFSSLGLRRYLSLLKYSRGIIGNSSSGIVEAPVLGIPTVNIGNRQRGRLQAESIVNCEPIKEKIREAISIISSEDFSERIKDIKCPYDGDNSSKMIVRYIKDAFNNGISLEKTFYDIDFEI